MKETVILYHIIRVGLGMIALKLDAHFFLQDFKYPENKDITKLIELFSDLELMPQYFEEQNVQTQQKKKMLSFVNPITNKSVFFNTDKILFSYSLNPFEHGSKSKDDLFNEFFEFIKLAVNACEAFAEENLHGNRLSIVGDFIEQINTDTANSNLAKNITRAMPWCEDPLKEVMLRTCETKNLSSVDEEVNVVISVNDGFIEQNFGGFSEKKNCFLVQYDINSLPENKEPRFTPADSIKVWQELKDLAVERLEKISAYLTE